MSSLQGWGWLVTKYGSLMIDNTHSSHLAQCSNTSAFLKHPVHFQQASPWARSAGAWGWMLGLWLRTGNWKHPQFWKGGVGMQGKGQWGSFLERDELCEYTPSKKKKNVACTHTHADLLWILEGDYSFQRLDSRSLQQIQISSTSAITWLIFHTQSEKQREKRSEKRLNALGNGLSMTKDTASRSPESWK